MYTVFGHTEESWTARVVSVFQRKEVAVKYAECDDMALWVEDADTGEVVWRTSWISDSI